MFISLFTLLCFSSLNAHATPIKRYTVKSAIVEYEISGAQTGSETLYFKNFGEKEARYSQMNIKMFGFNSETKNLTIIDRDWLYTINLKEKQGTKMNIAKAQEMAMKGMQNPMLQNFGKKAIQKMGGIKEGTEKILGKTCQIYSFPQMNMKVWIYNGILLKSTMNYSGMEMNYIAKSLQENVAIPQDKLAIPEDITLTEAPDMSKSMKNLDMKSMFGNSVITDTDQNEDEQLMKDTKKSIEKNKSTVKKTFGLLKSIMK